MIRVLALGCFEVLHPGHIAHLREARALGDHLTVAVTYDESVNKGPGRPLFPLVDRATSLCELSCVDLVRYSHNPEDTILAVKPDIYVKGIEYYKRCPEQKLVEKMGGVVKFIDSKPRYSSTKIMTGEMLRERIESLSTSC